MNYAWEFAPGSFINVAFKTASDEFNQFINDKYYRNLRNTLSDDQQINFSVKVIYFLDYLSLKKKNKTN